MKELQAQKNSCYTAILSVLSVLNKWGWSCCFGSPCSLFLLYSLRLHWAGCTLQVVWYSFLSKSSPTHPYPGQHTDWDSGQHFSGRRGGFFKLWFENTSVFQQCTIRWIQNTVLFNKVHHVRQSERQASEYQIKWA